MVMSRATQITTRSLDLVARNVDRVSTLVEALNNSGILLPWGEDAHGLAWLDRKGEVFPSDQVLAWRTEYGGAGV